MGFPESFTFDDFTFATTPIPEPASTLMAAVGLGALLARRRVAGAHSSDL
jgi:MYXO-CTERM domain-containing protein